jgi:hypothetical protein
MDNESDFKNGKIFPAKPNELVKWEETRSWETTEENIIEGHEQLGTWWTYEMRMATLPDHIFAADVPEGDYLRNRSYVVAPGIKNIPFNTYRITCRLEDKAEALATVRSREILKQHNTEGDS